MTKYCLIILRTALSQFHNFKSNNETINIYKVHCDTAQSLRNNLILEKFANEIENIKKDINEKTAIDIRSLVREYNDIFALLNDLPAVLPAVMDLEHEIQLNTIRAISTPIYNHPIAM